MEKDILLPRFLLSAGLRLGFFCAFLSDNMCANDWRADATMFKAEIIE